MSNTTELAKKINAAIARTAIKHNISEDDLPIWKNRNSRKKVIKFFMNVEKELFPLALAGLIYLEGKYPQPSRAQHRVQRTRASASDGGQQTENQGQG